MPAIALQQLFIGGARVDATSGETFTTVNPANGAVLAQVQSASRQDVDTAVASAEGIWKVLLPRSGKLRLSNMTGSVRFDVSFPR